MSARIRCHLLTPTEGAVRTLRVYEATAGRCPGRLGYHNAVSKIGLMEVPKGRLLGVNGGPSVDRVPDDDPRWPTHCASCSHVFSAETLRLRLDQWTRLYRRADTGEALSLSEAEVGAMWFADWYSNVYRGADGRCLVVRTPGGDWIVDSAPSTGGRWIRDGEPPDVTVSPSILFDGAHGGPLYHGFLRAGWLEEC